MILYFDDLPSDDLQSTRNRSSVNRILILALLISCLLHFLALLIFPEWRLWKPAASTHNLSIQLSIQQPIVKKIEELVNHHMTEKSIDENPAKEKPVKLPENNISTPTEIVTTQGNAVETVPKKIEFLTKEDLQDLSRNDEANYSSDDSLAFNPGLKENREKTRAMPNGGAYKQDLKAWRDIHGNQFYEVDGRCYKAISQTKSISTTDNATNWYFTSCGGKSESEKITDRINQEMKQRFRQ